MAMKQLIIIYANVIATPSSPLLGQNAEHGGATRLKTGATRLKMESQICTFVIPRRAASDITPARGCAYRMNDHNHVAEAKGNGMG